MVPNSSRSKTGKRFIIINRINRSPVDEGQDSLKLKRTNKLIVRAKSGWLVFYQ